MIDLTNISDNNGFIKIAALDHRNSLSSIVKQVEFSDFKSMCVANFSEFSSGVLLDRSYGEEARTRALNSNSGILWTAEKSGYTGNSGARLIQLYEDFNPSLEKSKLGINAIKVLVYYNNKSPTHEDTIKVVKYVSEETHKAGLPLLIEPITYEIEGIPYIKGGAILEAMQELKSYSDVLKVEFPIDVDDTVTNKDDQTLVTNLKEAIAYLQKYTEISAGQPWVLLSRGMRFDAFIKALQLSLENGAKGFAAGRTIWQDAGAFSTWEEKETFIETVARERMKELSALVDSFSQKSATA